MAEKKSGSLASRRRDARGGRRFGGIAAKPGRAFFMDVPATLES
jgi:hypothetical protein